MDESTLTERIESRRRQLQSERNEVAARLNALEAEVGNPATGTADLYILKRNGRQELFIKFEDGSGFTVAQSTT